MNNFVTEISEEDFKRLRLKGYDNERVEFKDGTSVFKFIEKELNSVLDDYKEYLADTIKGGENLPWVIAVCIHTEPQEEDIKYIKDTFFKGPNKERYSDEEAFNEALYDYSYYDKWMDRMGHTTYEMGIGLDHLYSTRDKWEARGWIDYFEVRKKETKAVYIVHLSGEPKEFWKNATD